VTPVGQPSFSVVVPAYRRPGALVACMRALALQDHRDLEVIVVDDGSPEPLAPAARAAAAGLALTVHRQGNAGPAAARNAGGALASGDYLAFTDDDCRPRPGWVTALAERARAHPGALLGGATVNALPVNPYATASQALVSYLYRAPTGAGRFFATNNIAVPRDAFREAGGFDASYPDAAGEDREFCLRWSGQGREMVFVADAVVDHAHHLDLRGFVRQHTAYGRGAARFHGQRAPGRGPFTQLEPVGFYLGVLRAPFADPDVRHPAPVAALLALSQAATAVGFLAERARRRRVTPERSRPAAR